MRRYSACEAGNAGLPEGVQEVRNSDIVNVGGALG